jgi:hypothetical protein
MEKEMKEVYYAYMLRLWREDAGSPWRATVQNPHTNEQKGFASVEELLDFLTGLTQDQRRPLGDNNG